MSVSVGEPPATVTASLRLSVSVTTLPAARSPDPAVIPVPDATTDDTVGAVVSICGPVWVRPFVDRVAAFPKLSCTVAPLRLIAVAASDGAFCPAPTV